jgi:glycosyltransferase involved in cell wall biosynthesis
VKRSLLMLEYIKKYSKLNKREIIKNDDLKVLLVSAFPPPVGGDATWAVEYLEYSKKNDFRTRLVNTSITGKRALTTNDSWNALDEVKRCVRIWNDINQGLKEFSPDIVHLNTNCSPKGVIRDYLSALLIKLYRKPFVLHCHCNVQDQIGTNKIGNWCLKKLLRLSSRVLVLNSNSFNFISSMSVRNIEILPNFIQNEFISEHKIVNEKIKKVIFIGHLKKSKGVNEFLQAAKSFPQVEFYLAGPITEDYSKSDILNRGAGNIYLLGSISIEKVKELLDQSDIFLFPSYTEGFSRALLEAMARGIPVIASDVGANKDMIEEFGGCIIQKENISEIVESINYMNAYSIRKQMSEWNIQKVRNFYSINIIMERLRALYLDVVKEKNM